MFIKPTSHFIAVCPIINGIIGKTPKKANGIKMQLSNSSAGIDEKEFLIHKCLSFVVFLNQE